MFELVNGYYPEIVRHTCDTPLCINPDHLVEGSPLDNVSDRVQRGRSHGHVSEEELNEVVSLRGKGMTHKAIGIELGIKTKRVAWILDKIK